MLQIVQAYDRSPIAELPADDGAALESKLASAHKVFRDRDGWLWWQLREVVLALELRGVDAIVAPLTRALPLAARVVRGPAVVMLSFGLNVQLRHARGLRRSMVVAALRAASRIVCLAESQRRDLLACDVIWQRADAAQRMGERWSLK